VVCDGSHQADPQIHFHRLVRIGLRKLAKRQKGPTYESMRHVYSSCAPCVRPSRNRKAGSGVRAARLGMALEYTTGANCGPVPAQRRSNAAASQLMTDTAARTSKSSNTASIATIVEIQPCYCSGLSARLVSAGFDYRYIYLITSSGVASKLAELASSHTLANGTNAHALKSKSFGTRGTSSANCVRHRLLSPF
jgi:hypothetical protein